MSDATGTPSNLNGASRGERSGQALPSSIDTLIVCVVDRSGSMAAIREDAIGGFNTFLQEQRKLPGSAAMSLVLFNHQYEVVHRNVALANVPLLDESTYIPEGMTALHDALGHALVGSYKSWGSLPEDARPSVVVCILTDGLENSSREYSAEVLRQLIEARKVDGWEFVFLAANQDAVLSARTMGLADADAAAFSATKEGVREAYDVAFRRVASHRSERRR